MATYGLSKFQGILFLFLVLSCNVYSQTCCTGGAPLIGSLNISDLDKGSFGITFSYDFNKIEDFFQENRKLKEDFIKRRTETAFFQLDYSFDGNTSISFMLPFVSLMEEIDQLGSIQRHLNTSIGDLVFMAQHKFIRNAKNSLMVGVGVKLPTGETQSRDDEDQFILVPTLQSGTGSIDYITLLNTSHKMKFRKTLLVSQSLSFRLNTNSSKFASHNNYRFGNEFQSITSFSDQLVLGQIVTYPAILGKIRITSKDKIDTHFNENTGGTWIYIGPGWTAQLSPSLSVSLSADFPILRRLNGFQITTTTRVRSSLNMKI